MLQGIIGQARTVTLLKKLAAENQFGRTIILTGPAGSGKYTLGEEFARGLLGSNPYSSTDFQCFRNDRYDLKTAYFLKTLGHPATQRLLPGYLDRLQARLSAAVALGEISKSGVKLKKTKKGSGESANVQDFRAELEEILINQRLWDELRDNPALTENLTAVSAELSKKQRLPIDFIRGAIAFHSQKPVGKCRVTLLGGFETATEEAQNSSLKLFEEPPATSLIILTASRLDTVLPTILSRSLVITLDTPSPAQIAQILGLEDAGDIRSTLGWIEEGVFNYRDRRRALVNGFFSGIAPHVQRDYRLFPFIEQVNADDTGRLSLEFLDELTRFLEGLNNWRENTLRGITPAADSTPYSAVYLKLAREAQPAEMQEMVREISRIRGGTAYGNWSEGTVLPALLLTLARWYQRRAR